MNKSSKKILFIGNSKLAVFGFRGEIIEKMIEEGYKVYVAFPNGPFGEGEETSKQYGCEFIETKMSRRGTNPIKDIKLLHSYIKIIKKIKPDIVFAFTVKCDIYGGIACRLLKIPFVPNITGLGKGLTEGKVTKFLTKNLYRVAIKKAQCVFFQNNGDYKFFIDNKIKFKKSVILPGSGVNLKKFTPLSYPNDDIIRFIYIARIMKAKGIEEYLEAARTIKSKYNNIEFHICGYCEEDYKETIEKEESLGNIVYHGLVDNIQEHEKNCHCVVLPSFHPEGISNVLLEAAACARPIITTNRTGCMEAVDDQITGFLTNEKDSNDLIKKIQKFINLSNDEKKIMGLRGRKKVEKEFDRNNIIKEYQKIVSEM